MSIEINTSKISCPSCSSTKIRKTGINKNKIQSQQRYSCKDCKKVFILNQQQSKNKTYPITTILNTLSLYNLGHPQSQILKLLKTNTKPSQKTISNWINEHKHLTPYNRLRQDSIKQYKPEDLIQQHNFLHNNLNYKYQLHNYKLSIAFQDTKFDNHSKFLPIKAYLNKIPTSKFPHNIFTPTKEINNTSRASQSQFNTLKTITTSKHNLANQLASLALNLAKNNKERHQTIQDFMLTNDSTTIATEIPIYLTKDDLLYFASRGFNINPKEFSTPITGHIDFLQIRNNNIQILDYKPEAKKETPTKQLTIYALALASRTKLDLKSFKCAWFDQNNYYEFFPLHLVKNRNIYI